MQDVETSFQIELLTLRVTANDVFWSLRTGQSNPVLFALQRATHTLWNLENGEAHESVAPYRACHLPHVELGDEPWERADELNRREWRIELRPATRG